MTKRTLIALIVVALLAPASLFAQPLVGGARSSQLGAAYLLRGESTEALESVGFAEDFRLDWGFTLLGTQDPTSSVWYGFDMQFLVSRGSTTYYSTDDSPARAVFIDTPVRGAAAYNLGALTVSGFAGPAINWITVDFPQTAEGDAAELIASLFGVGLDLGVRAQYEWGPYLEVAYSLPNLIEFEGSPTLTNPAGLRITLGWYVWTEQYSENGDAEAMEPGDI